MNFPRRFVAVAATAALAAASVLLIAPISASALPALPTNPVGTVTSGIAGLTLTITQESNVAVVNFASLVLVPGETLDIVQDEGDILIVRNTDVGSAAIAGTVTADATVIFTSPGGFAVTAGSIHAGGDLIITTGAIADADVLLPIIPIDPTVTDGVMGTAAGAAISADHSVGLVGKSVVHGGSMDAFDGYAILRSVDTSSYNASGFPPLGGGFVGLAGGSVGITGSVFANGSIITTAPAPSAQDIEGTLVTDGTGTIPSQIQLIGAGVASQGLQALAFSNIDDAVGAQFPATAIVSDGAPVSWAENANVYAGGDTAPQNAGFSTSGLGIGPGPVFAFPSIEARCSVDDEGVRSTSIEVPGGATLFNVQLVPVGYDYNIPNQAPISLDGGTIAFNEQVHTIVGGWDVLTVTAVHLLGGEDLDIKIGVFSCAVPYVPALAATGVDAPTPALAGAALLLLAGVVLVARRRRTTPSQERASLC